MILYVIRHGETSWNVQQRMQGHEGADLNENGIRLAEITAEGLKDVSFDLCVSSPLIRARHTAEILLKGRVPIHEDARLMEIGFGIWEGRRVAGENPEIPKEQYDLFRKSPFQYQPPEGGESISQVLERTGELFDELLADQKMTDKTILISTHGGALRAFLNRLYPDPGDFWQNGVPMNCSYSTVEVKNGVPVLTGNDLVCYGEEDCSDFYRDWLK